MQVYTPSPSVMSPPPFARHPDNRQSQLLTPISHFPSRMLPPPGTVPRVLPGATATTGPKISIGTTVEVRRFNMRTKTWMPWNTGVVTGHRIERFHVGTEVDLYDVKTSYPNVWMETYIPFLGELRDGLHYRPSDNAQEMMDKVADMKKVFAYVQVLCSNGSTTYAWLPAIVMSKRSEPIPLVYVLAGPMRGQKSVPAPHILPYNPETAEAIRKNGQIIYWEKGTD
ncbi:hypothetical protein M0805_008708 [Coniferiporia weirii]|nr:hypothetical protein M0805_008708 [Coniferiporia weirii]